MSAAKYDAIGIGYDTTRRPDPHIAQRLVALLEPSAGGRYIDIACGTGNYTHCLHVLGVNVIGIDNSAIMLDAARAKFPSISWQQSDVTVLPFPDGHFAGAICTLAIHHFPDLKAAFLEISRVLSQGRFVIFTATRDQMRSYWLNAYFPAALRRSIEQCPRDDELRDALEHAQFAIVATEPWFVPEDPIDHFLYSGKHHPILYLDQRVRSGISTFSSLAEPAEVEAGLTRLKSDIETGAIRGVMANDTSDRGDYLFLVAQKLSQTPIRPSAAHHERCQT